MLESLDRLLHHRSAATLLTLSLHEFIVVEGAPLDDREIRSCDIASNFLDID